MSVDGNAARASGTPAFDKPKPVVGDFIGYASTYVGAALISGAVVHHPLDPSRFTAIAIIGAVVFLLATAFTEFVINRQRATTRSVVLMVPTSLALSFGIGSLSGGMQHFEDVPARAAVLIPVGLALSFIAYVLRYHAGRWRSMVRPAGLALLATAALSFVALHQLAVTMPAPGHDHGSHSDGGHQEAPPPAAPQPAPAASTGPQQPAPENPPARTPPLRQSDGHTHSHNG